MNIKSLSYNNIVLEGSVSLYTIRNRLILLHRSRFITRRMLYRLKEYDATLKLIFSLTPHEISQFFSIPMQKAIQLHHDIHHTELTANVERDSREVKVMTCYDEIYPHHLRMIPDAPLVLYALGKLELMHEPHRISIIGTRNPSREALDKLTYVAHPLITNGWVVVSGLAYGIDHLAHQLTIHHKGNTIAVLGSGFNQVYPRAHMPTFKRITRFGLALSEYPPDTKAKRYHFPERNRIISGLSEATLVIEATERSGTLITVDQALDQGREVYAVPGSPLVAQTAGCHKLIQEGAKLVQSAADILEDWPV